MTTEHEVHQHDQAATVAAEGAAKGPVAETKGKFEPKEAVKLNPPKDDPITLEELKKCDGGFLHFLVNM